jgi:hypothetical protein
MAANAKSAVFKVGDFEFNILHVRLYSTHSKDHLLHYCANSRVVKSEKLIQLVLLGAQSHNPVTNARVGGNAMPYFGLWPSPRQAFF